MSEAMREILGRLVRGESLSEDEAERAMGIIMAGEATDAQIGAFCTALRLKGETAEEISGCARAMRARVTRVPSRHPLLVDVVGTGGDGANTFNISTTAAFVVAAAGLPVAKHGNRAISSATGSADVLEALGVRIDLSPEAVGRCIDEVGIGFLFAPALHGAMKHAAGPRRELGFRTVFNLMGPLTNPAGAQAEVAGVFDPALTEVFATVLLKLGARRALAVHGAGGLDELSLAGPNRVSEAWRGEVRTYTVDPEELGLAPAPVEALRGGSPQENAAITRAVLRGERGPWRDVTLLNAAAGLLAGERVESLAEGIAVAAEAIDRGWALERLEALCALSQELAEEERVAG